MGKESADGGEQECPRPGSPRQSDPFTPRARSAPSQIHEPSHRLIWETAETLGGDFVAALDGVHVPGMSVQSPAFYVDTLEATGHFAPNAVTAESVTYDQHLAPLSPDASAAEAGASSGAPAPAAPPPPPPASPAARAAWRAGPQGNPVLAYVGGTTLLPVRNAIEKRFAGDGAEAWGTFEAAYDRGLRSAYPLDAEGGCRFPYVRLLLCALKRG